MEAGGSHRALGRCHKPAEEAGLGFDSDRLAQPGYRFESKSGPPNADAAVPGRRPRRLGRGWQLRARPHRNGAMRPWLLRGSVTRVNGPGQGREVAVTPRPWPSRPGLPGGRGLCAPPDIVTL